MKTLASMAGYAKSRAGDQQPPDQKDGYRWHNPPLVLVKDRPKLGKGYVPPDNNPCFVLGYN